MSKSWLLCVLLGTLAWGQAAPSAPPPAQTAPGPGQSAPKPQTPPDPSASVPADAPVITVIGVCPSPAKTGTAAGAAAKTGTAKAAPAKAPAADCKTVITKVQFEKLAAVLVPNVTPQVKRQLASLLPRVIALSDAAKKQGLDQKPEFKENLKFVTMQVLSNELQKKIQKEAADVPEADIEKYYKENAQTYEQYSVERIFVPRTKQSESDVKEDDKDEKLTDEQKKAKEAEDKAKSDAAEQVMTKLAAELRERAAKGEEFAKLQKEAYEAAAQKVDAPNVSLTNIRRSGLPPAQVSALDLKPGEVSQVISDAGGHYIYKLVSKSEIPLEQARTEIHNKLQNDRIRERMDKLNNSFKAETNDAYFGPGGLNQMPPPRIPRPRPGMPPVPQSGQPQQAPPAEAPAAKPN